MKHAIIGIGACGAVIAGTPMAWAAGGEWGDWYVSGLAGGMLLMDSQNQGNNNPLNFKSSYNPGEDYLLAVGAYRATQVRTELEIGYRTAKFNRVSFTNDAGLGAAAGAASLDGVTAAAPGARFNAISAMLNAYYDYDTGSAWRPYIDAGIGAARLAANGVAVDGVPVVNASDVVFAYQFGIGIGYEVTHAITLATEYRYFSTLDPTFKDATGASFNSSFTSHNLSLGVRYRF